MRTENSSPVAVGRFRFHPIPMEQAPDAVETAMRQNAGRLAEDAHLLLANGKFASCALLQFFALEELGKIYLRRLNEKPKKTGFHVRKQQAAMLLACGTQTARFLRQRLIDLSLPLGIGSDEATLDDFELLKRFGGGALWQWLEEQGGFRDVFQAMEPRSGYAAAAHVGIFEYLRRVAAYVDENPTAPAYLPKPLTPDSFEDTWAQEAMVIIADAVAALDDPQSFAVARSLDTSLSLRLAQSKTSAVVASSAVSLTVRGKP